MRSLSLFLAVLLSASGAGINLAAQDLLSKADLEQDHKLSEEIKAHHELMKNAEYLSDMLGPRLTGSENLRKANRWAEEKFREYGLDNVRQEPWALGRSWTRGKAQGRITAPAEHPITLASYGWVAGTKGAIRGPVVYINAKKPEDLEPFKGKLKGAIVVLFAPREIEKPPNPMLAPYSDPVLPMNTLKPRLRFDFFGPLYQFLTEQGAGALLMLSDKPYALLNMFGLGYLSEPKGDPFTVPGDKWGIGPTPAAYVGWEDYNLIWRLLQRGPVEMELNLQNSYSEKPVEIYNTVAEIKGSEKPDEVVMLGAHLDSWDLGTGATDNGTGVVVVLEAARALLKSGAKPKRTIRFVLFSGEEEFLLGSRAYVKSHESELPKISGILVHDLGTGRVLSLALDGNYAAREITDQVLEPMHRLGLLEPTLRSLYASDDAAFDNAGVPGFLAIQEITDYNLTHHSQADTFDRIHEDGLVEGAQVLAQWAYNVAQLPNLLPRKPAAEGASSDKH
jgi:carboxypeptidase Q